MERDQAEQRMECVRQQILALAVSGERSIRCPYCGGGNTASIRRLCCDTLRHAVAVILFTQRSIDLMDRVDASREN
jgi:hypothetical protein